MAREVGGLRFYVYETALKGFAVANLPPAAVETLRRHPRVLFVEEDALVPPLDIIQNVSAPADTGLYSLDRNDQRSRSLDGSYTYFADGTGVHIYIVDSGVRGGYQEFTGRIGNGAAFIKWSWHPNPYNDQLGHGTSVAGASAGSTVGVAKGATIHSVRTNDGNINAYASDIIAGLDWVAGNRILPAVANLSYEATSQAIATAVSGVINAGVAFTAAAGNSAVDACNAVTQTTGVITVGATTVSDTRASYSNCGSCLDVFAPGGSVGGVGGLKLASNSSDASYTHSWGTSFAAPYSELSGSLRHTAGSADFELQAALTDTNTVAWWSNPYSVMVSPEAPECLDQ